MVTRYLGFYIKKFDKYYFSDKTWRRLGFFIKIQFSSCLVSNNSNF